MSMKLVLDYVLLRVFGEELLTFCFVFYDFCIQMNNVIKGGRGGQLAAAPYHKEIWLSLKASCILDLSGVSAWFRVLHVCTMSLCVS